MIGDMSFEDFYRASCVVCGDVDEILDMFSVVKPWRKAKEAEIPHAFHGGVRDLRHICKTCFRQRVPELKKEAVRGN